MNKRPQLLGQQSCQSTLVHVCQSLTFVSPISLHSMSLSPTLPSLITDICLMIIIKFSVLSLLNTCDFGGRFCITLASSKTQNVFTTTITHQLNAKSDSRVNEPLRNRGHFFTFFCGKYYRGGLSK